MQRGPAGGQLRAVVRTQLAAQVVAMRVHGLGADVEFTGDLFGGESARDEVEDFALARGQWGVGSVEHIGESHGHPWLKVVWAEAHATHPGDLPCGG